MAVVSGIACILGATIICVDLLVQHLPGQQNFRIQDSGSFLSASLSLSAGVMLFSSLYSMLPTSNRYLKEAGFSPSAAAYTLIGTFLGGVIVIQFISIVLHRYMPSHVVDCDHSHDHVDKPQEETDHDSDRESSASPTAHNENTPLLSRSSEQLKKVRRVENRDSDSSTLTTPVSTRSHDLRRPSLHASLSHKVSSFISGDESHCDDSGPCYGFSHPCGQECYKHVRQASSRASTASRSKSLGFTKGPSKGSGNILVGVDEEANIGGNHHSSHWGTHDHEATESRDSYKLTTDSTTQSEAHHHHVPQNAFMSIGLQTLIAIALHKMPEGFITFATNHANPKLGFAVFMALFIHNLTEGFVMALPLYLALSSRWRAILYSSILGGLTQPLGAGVAAAWFKIAGRSDMAPGEGVYGVMFAITAGIMTSVALQLFSESVALYHNRMLCIAFAFIGMGILGLSFALTA
ncbi:MAG: hypothetical protein M1814_002061 [Vezdaea aestivalis]|nr:MAG: hypothetical protein M1814_002061 [Vezdaea aestivalis]